MPSAARLLIPALRSDSSGGFSASEEAIDRALEAGVGGFILFGGTAAAVEELVSRIVGQVSYPLLIGSDLERGLGQQVERATSLPPAAAIASLDDLEITRSAGYLTAVEAGSLGINWIFAPVADLDIEPRNPIVSTRAFGSDPLRVGAQLRAWIQGCHDGGAMACAKHFPGHGRTTGDSHIEKTHVTADRETLEADLLPFRAAVTAGVDSMMTAHVAYAALDPSGEVATLSSPILKVLLRQELGFDGLIVSDALGMAGLSQTMGEGGAAIAALKAGCDVLLYPEDQGGVLEALTHAVEIGELSWETVRLALARVDAAHTSIREYGTLKRASLPLGWADAVAARTLTPLRGRPTVSGKIRLVEIDDDLGGPHAVPSREAFREGLSPRLTPVESEGATPVLAIYAEPRAWKGRSGLSSSAIESANELLRGNTEARVVIFGHPRLADEIPAARHVLCAWGGEPVMQRAAAAWFLAKTSLPTVAALPS